MDYHLLMRSMVTQNLKLLGFDDYCAKSRRKLDLNLNSDSFRKLSQNQFQTITYFLFAKLNKTECKKRYLGCYPALDRKQESDFRQRTHQWFQELTSNELIKYNGRVAAIFFQNPGGDMFTQLYLELSNIILAKTSASLTHKLGVKVAAIDTKQTKLLINETKKNVEMYKTEKQNYFDRNAKWDQHFEHFKSDQIKLKQRLAEELEKQNSLLEKVKSADVCVDRDSIDNYLLDSSGKVEQLSTKLENMNSLVDENRKIYETVLNIESNSSDQALLESNRIFSQINASDNPNNLIESFQTRLTDYDQTLSTADETNFKELSENCSKLLSEANHYKQKISTITNEFDSMSTSLEQEVKQTREQLLKHPKIIERKEWFRQQLAPIMNINLKIGSQFAKLPKEKVIAVNDITTKFMEECDAKNSPIIPNRPSILNYSFNMGDLSSYGYVPPSGAISDESLMFSPICPQTDD